jgi:hypothetical protein
MPDVLREGAVHIVSSRSPEARGRRLQAGYAHAPYSSLESVVEREKIVLAVMPELLAVGVFLTGSRRFQVVLDDASRDYIDRHRLCRSRRIPARQLLATEARADADLFLDDADIRVRQAACPAARASPQLAALITHGCPR